MLLSTGAFSEFTRFMQISFLLILPLLAVMLGITTIIHYRKKRKKSLRGEKDTVEQLIDGTPDGLNYEGEDADYVYYDQSGLISAYKSKLVYSHARFTALQHDYNRINNEYDILLRQVKKSLFNTKKITMEELTSQPQSANPEILATWMNEKKELQEKLRQLNSSFQSLERENASLTDQLGMLTGSDEEKAAIVNNWKEESGRLYDKVAEQDYLKDILEEKKNQIEFLQMQLEQRIQKFHKTEMRSKELVVELEQANNTVAASVSALQTAEARLAEHREQAQEFQNHLNEKEELITEKLNTITWLENTLQETKQQNEMLNAMAADNNDKVIVLEQLLDAEQAKVVQLEQKLAAHKQVLARLHHEIANCIETDGPVSLVVELNTGYAREEKKDWQGDMITH